MEMILVISIIFSVFYFLTVVGIIVWMKRKDIRFFFRYRNNRDKLVRCIFLMPNGFFKDDVYLLHDENDMIEYEGGEYQVNSELGFYSTNKNILTMVYVFRKPAPINFNDMGKDNIPEYDASGLQKALDEKFIRDLLSESNKMMLLLILVIVNTAISALIALQVFGVIDNFKGGG